MNDFIRQERIYMTSKYLVNSILWPGKWTVRVSKDMTCDIDVAFTLRENLFQK